MTLAVVLLATPLFGLVLNPPMLDPMVSLQVSGLQASESIEDGFEGTDEGAGEDEGEGADEDPGADASEDEGASEEAEYEAQVKKRNELAEIHRPLGIATWAAMTVTVGLGFIQYYNLYGFGAGAGDNPCVTGDAIFGQGQCTGTPWPHAIAAGVTTGLYGAAFTVSLMMPDPDDLASGKGEFAETLRMHKTLRWVHFSGMIAQIVLGIVIANAPGLDRANDYGTLQALSTLHLATGLVTYGALTWAGALMTF